MKITWPWRRGTEPAETRALEFESAMVLAMWGGRTSSAGVTVGRDTALAVTACSRAVRLIAEAVALLPTVVLRRLDGGGQERATDHPAYRLVHDDACDWLSAYDLKLRVMIDALTHDRGGFALVNRVGGRPFELLHLPADSVRVTYGPGGEPSYVLQESTGQRQLDRRDVIHIRAFGHLDRSPLSLAVEAVGLAVAQQQFAGRLMRNGAKPSSIIAAKEKLAPAALENLVKLVRAQTTGDQEGSTMVIPADVSFNASGWSPEDLELLASRRFLVEEIARAFQVPPHLLFEMGRATWSNSAEMGQAFVKFTLLPWLETWHGAIRRTLLTPDERQTLVVETIVDDLTRADLPTRAAAYASMIQSRILSPNEVRAMEGRPPYPGGDTFQNPNTTTDGGASAGDDDAA